MKYKKSGRKKKKKRIKEKGKGYQYNHRIIYQHQNFLRNK